jgi:D-3-phosphoglycerate dehydrogenase
MVDIETLLTRADVISLHLALTDKTRGIIGTKHLAHTKPGVILVNTARAALIDEAALIAALESGTSATLGLTFSMPSRSSPTIRWRDLKT